MPDVKTIISNYKPSSETVDLVRQTPILLICGIVGAGKNTVINEVIKDTERFHLIVSHTTRKPRENHGVMEQQDVDYHFVSMVEMEQLLHTQELVEAKFVHGNVYATSAAELTKANAVGKIATTDTDIQGVVEYLDIKPTTHAIFLLPPSVDSWLKRLERRYGNLEEHQEELRKRFTTARKEIAHALKDKRFIIVINDDLETTTERINSVIAGHTDKSSEYAEVVTEHLLSYIDSQV